MLIMLQLQKNFSRLCGRASSEKLRKLCLSPRFLWESSASPGASALWTGLTSTRKGSVTLKDRSDCGFKMQFSGHYFLMRRHSRRKKKHWSLELLCKSNLTLPCANLKLPDTTTPNFNPSACTTLEPLGADDQLLCGQLLGSLGAVDPASFSGQVGIRLRFRKMYSEGAGRRKPEEISNMGCKYLGFLGAQNLHNLQVLVERHNPATENRSRKGARSSTVVCTALSFGLLAARFVAGVWKVRGRTK